MSRRSVATTSLPGAVGGRWGSRLRFRAQVAPGQGAAPPAQYGPDLPRPPLRAGSPLLVGHRPGSSPSPEPLTAAARLSRIRGRLLEFPSGRPLPAWAPRPFPADRPRAAQPAVRSIRGAPPAAMAARTNLAARAHANIRRN